MSTLESSHVFSGTSLPIMPSGEKSKAESKKKKKLAATDAFFSQFADEMPVLENPGRPLNRRADTENTVSGIDKTNSSSYKEAVNHHRTRILQKIWTVFFGKEKRTESGHHVRRLRFETLENRALMNATDEIANVLAPSALVGPPVPGSANLEAIFENMNAAELADAITTLEHMQATDAQSVNDLNSDISSANATVSQDQNTVASDDKKCADDTATLTNDQNALSSANQNVTNAQNAVNASQSAYDNEAALLAHDTQVMNTDQSLFNQVQQQLNSYFSPRQPGYWDTWNLYQTRKYNLQNDIGRMTNEKNALAVLQNQLTAAKTTLTNAQNVQTTDASAVATDTQTLAADQDADNKAHTQLATDQSVLDTLSAQQSDVQAHLDAVNNALALAQNRQNEITAEENQAANDADIQTHMTTLASEAAQSVLQSMEAEANQIGYAKMFVSMEQLPSTDTRLYVRFRNPAPSTYIDMHIDGGGLGQLVDQPAADCTVPITLRPGDGANGPFTIYLRDGQTHAILQEVNGMYDRYAQKATIFTAQSNFSIDETGMAAENPIQPSLKVAEIQGTTLLLSASSPHDQMIISTDTGGFLSSTILQCEGGSAFDCASVTMVTAPSNVQCTLHS